jgi:hypothetical protein
VCLDSMTRLLVEELKKKTRENSLAFLASSSVLFCKLLLAEKQLDCQVIQQRWKFVANKWGEKEQLELKMIKRV